MDGFAAEEQSLVVASGEDGDAVADTYPPLLVLLPGDDDDLPLSKRQLVVIISLTVVDGFHPADFTPHLQNRDRTVVTESLTSSKTPFRPEHTHRADFSWQRDGGVPSAVSAFSGPSRRRLPLLDG